MEATPNPNDHISTITSLAATTAPNSLAPSSPNLPPQELIILCGLIGSGKSTLSSAMSQQLPASSNSRSYIRVNQDELGDRRTCEARVHSALKKGYNVIIDRQNFDRKQRRVWLELASHYTGLKVGGWVMGTSLQECERRVKHRQDHPTIHDPQLAVRLIHQFNKQWEHPRINEGFDHLVTLPSLPSATEITLELLQELLKQLWESPSNPLGAEQRKPGTIQQIRSSTGPIRNALGANGTGRQLPWATSNGSGNRLNISPQKSLESFGFRKSAPGP